MTFLPIVQRELRVAARRSSTYWLRFFAALAVLVMWIILLMGTRRMTPAQLSQHILTMLGSLTLGFCMMAGVFLTADSVRGRTRNLNFAHGPSVVGCADMLVEFTKMNGAGNDFVLIDNRERQIKLSPEQVIRICHRQRGVGADGLFLLVPNTTGKAQWSWEFYNSDGSTADMCGNGARCFARFIEKKAGANGKTTFETGAGVITAAFQGERVTVNLTAPRDFQLGEKIITKEGPVILHALNTGVPHAVIFVPDADKAMVQQLGHEIRNHPHFAPKGTNVNFVQVLGKDSIRVRTYERGVEGETLACGTGVTASALVSSRVHRFSSPIKVQVQGGDILEVSFKEQAGNFSDVRLTGPAEFVFEGRLEI